METSIANLCFLAENRILFSSIRDKTASSKKRENCQKSKAFRVRQSQLVGARGSHKMRPEVEEEEEVRGLPRVRMQRKKRRRKKKREMMKNLRRKRSRKQVRSGAQLL